MKLRHRTWAKNARSILKDGFDENLPHIWLQEEADFNNEIKVGEGGDVFLEIDVPKGVLAQAITDKPMNYTRYRIPPKLLNDFCGKPAICATLYQGMTRSPL